MTIFLIWAGLYLVASVTSWVMIPRAIYRDFKRGGSENETDY